MRKILPAILFVFCFLSFAATATPAQTSNIVKISLSQPEIDKIIKAFSEKEAEYRDALKNYSFRRVAKVQSIGDGGQVTGEFFSDSIFIFKDNGDRFEKILLAPVPTLGAITKDDINDLGGVNQFALDPSKVNQYNFTFLGKEKIDELNLYVFDVQPKVIPDPKKSKERVFSGRIWIDDEDLQIVKTKGKGLPETKDDKYPVVETFRENIDGKYWFPTYAYSNDELLFDNGTSLRIKMLVKYTEYKEAKSTVRILDDGEEVVDETNQKPADKPAAPPAEKKP